MTRVTQPTKSTRNWLAKHAAIVRHFERITHKRVSTIIRRQSRLVAAVSSRSER
jgi:ribosomal protein S10